MLSGSTGKTFVSALILKLVEEGRLSLEDNVATWLGDRAWFRQLPNAQSVTIRMLLSHSSGIPDYVGRPDFMPTLSSCLGRMDTCFSTEELISYVIDSQPLFPAGLGYFYSDVNYLLLGLIIESASGQKYSDMLQSSILSPFNLEQTSMSDGVVHRSLATGYVDLEALPFLPEEMVSDGKLVLNPSFEWTGGGLVTSAVDLARWIKILHEDGYLTPILTQSIIHSTAPLPVSAGVWYGLGSYVWDDGIEPIAYGHGGWFPGYRTSMGYYPTVGLAIAVQVNTDKNSDAHRYRRELAKIIMRELTRDKLIGCPLPNEVGIGNLHTDSTATSAKH
jgi:D-alanyl-D-alanine carboxypeptidase